MNKIFCISTAAWEKPEPSFDVFFHRYNVGFRIHCNISPSSIRRVQRAQLKLMEAHNQ